MSSANNLPLTKEQEDLLKELEEEFKDRYTEKDEDFMAVFNEDLPDPPIIGNWYDNFRNRFRGGNRYHPYDSDRRPYDRRDYNDRRGYDRRDYNDRRGYERRDYNDRRHHGYRPY